MSPGEGRGSAAAGCVGISASVWIFFCLQVGVTRQGEARKDGASAVMPHEQAEKAALSCSRATGGIMNV